MLGLRHGGSYSAVMAAILVASLMSSIAGFAFSAICGAMLFHLLNDQVQVVQIMITCSIANQAAMVWSLRREVDWRGLGVFLAGGALGLPFGVWALLHADHRLYTHSLGIVLLAYAAYMLIGRTHTICRQYPGLDLVAGLLGGVTGGAAGFPSGPVTVWCGLKGWDKTRQRAVFQPFILLMQVAALLAIAIATPQTGHGIGFNPSNLVYVPAGLSGTWLGLACFRGLSNRQFSLAVNILLLASGLSFLI